MDIEVMAPLANEVEDRKKFGWKNANEFPDFPANLSNSSQILARDKDMPNYDTITALEKKYETLKKAYLHYEPMNIAFAILTFCLGIIPFLIYLLVRANNKRNVESHNMFVYKELDSVKNEASALL